jgi:hypothetical protein
MVVRMFTPMDIIPVSFMKEIKHRMNKCGDGNNMDCKVKPFGYIQDCCRIKDNNQHSKCGSLEH